LAITTPPQEFTDRYRPLIGTDDWADFFAKLQQPLPAGLRYHSGRIDQAAFNQIAISLGWELSPVPWCQNGYWLRGERLEQSVSKSWPFFAGLVYLQESASMLPVRLLDAKPGENILDMSAAPGSKSTQIAQAMRGQGLLVANDKDHKRSKALVFNLEKYGSLNSVVTTYDGKELGNLLPEQFDRVLLDAPCSAEGAAQKDREYFRHWSPRTIEQLSKLQRALLLSAIKSCKVGGTIVYSTCTLAPEENEGNIDWLLREYSDYIEIDSITPGRNCPEASSGIVKWQGKDYLPEINNTLRLLPHRSGAEIFFVARLRKIASFRPTSEKQSVSRKHSTTHNPWLGDSKSIRKVLLPQIEERFGIAQSVFDHYRIATRQSDYWLVPAAIVGLPEALHVDRAGIPLARATRRDYRISFPFALNFGDLAVKNFVELNEQQMAQYISGQSPLLIAEQIETLSPGQVIVRYRGYSLGRALFSGKAQLKSQVKRAFVIL